MIDVSHVSGDLRTSVEINFLGNFWWRIGKMLVDFGLCGRHIAVLPFLRLWNPDIAVLTFLRLWTFRSAPILATINLLQCSHSCDYRPFAVLPFFATVDSFLY